MDVSELALTGNTDKTWGEAVAAIVQLEQGSSLTDDEITEHVRNTLAPYKVPKSIYFVSELPLTSSGKVQKSVLRDRYVNGLN